MKRFETVGVGALRKTKPTRERDCDAADPARLVTRSVLIAAVCAMPFNAFGQPAASSNSSVELPPVTLQSKSSSKTKTVKKKKPAVQEPSEEYAPPADLAQPAVEPDIVDTAAVLRALQNDGTAGDGYRASLASDVGPLGSRPLLTTPYSVSVMTKDLIANAQATSTDDIFKMHPFIHSMWPTARGNPLSTVLRGFGTTTMVDNMRRHNASVIDVEGLERVEVLTGLSGFLYGPADPGGAINYVQKSPTRTPFASVKGGLINDSGYAHVDIGGPIAPAAGTYYRFNAVRQDGGTAIDHQDVERTFVSGAVDFELSKNALLQLKGYHSDYKATGADAFWSVTASALYPSAPDAQKLYGQPWGSTNFQQTGGSAKLTWDIDDTFTFRSAYSYVDASSYGIAINNTISANNGRYTQAGIANAAGTLTTNAGYAALDTKIHTGPIKQTITTGYSAAFYESKLPLDPNFSFTNAGVFSLSNPTYVATKPAFSIGNLPESRFFTREVSSLFIGDTIDIGQYWTAIVGMNYATVAADSYNFIPPPGQPRTFQSRYDKSEWTPTFSLMFKPTPWASIYGMYIEGLEQGGSAPVAAANAGTVLPPYVSEQKEIGAKFRLGGAFLTVAAFDITKAYAYLDPDDNLYKAAGNQNHKGIEVGLSGKIFENLSVFGGFTVLDAKVVNDPALAGKKPVDVPDSMFKLYAEYNVPFVPGLTLTGGLYYTDEFAAFTNNRQFLPDVLTADLGFRYETMIDKTPVITRFNVSNVSDEDYWMSTRFLGAPRSYMLTVETQF